MIQAIGQILPLAVVLALSTVPLLVIVTILLSPRSAGSSVSFAIAWVAGIFVVTGLLLLGANRIPGPRSLRYPDTVAWTEIVIGVGLIAYGVVSFVRRRSRAPQTEVPKWLHAIGGVRPLPAAGLALALCCRPKALLICSAAAIALGSGRNDPTTDVVTLLVFVAIGASSVLAPVIVSLARPQTMRRPLQATERWITRNSSTVTFVAALVIGVVVVGHGMTQF